MAKGQNSIDIKGRSLVISGTVDTKTMTVEADGFAEPVNLQVLLEKTGFNGQLCKIQITENNTPINEGDLEDSE